MLKLTGQSLCDEIIGFHSNVLPHFTLIWEGNEDGSVMGALQKLGLVYNEHWNTSQKMAHNLQNRYAYSMPYLFSKIMSVQGYEKQNRNIIEVEGEGREDELNGEIANQLVKHACKKNKYEFNKDEVFEDGIVPCYGVFQFDLEVNRMGKTEVTFKRVPYNQLVWDLNFTDYERKTCSREQYFEWKYLDDLILEYPDKKADLEAPSTQSFDYEDAGYGKVRALQDYYTHPEGYTVEDGKWLVKVIHDYKRVNHTCYELHDIQNRKVEVYETKKDAEKAMAEGLTDVSNKMRLEGVYKQVLGEMPQPEVVLNQDDYFIIKPKPEKRIAYSVVTLNTVLQETEVLDEEEFRHIVYFCIFKNGKWITLADIGANPQQFIDKMYSQMDYDVGTDVKTAKQLNVNLVATQHQSIEDAKNALTSGDIIFSNSNEPIVQVIKRSGTNTQYFNLVGMMTELLNSSFGGAAFLAEADPSNQTASGIADLQQAGSVLTLNYLKNLNRFDLMFGEKLISLMQRYYDYETTVKVLGSDLTQNVMETLKANQQFIPSVTDPSTGWLVVNKDGTAPLPDSSLVVNVTIQNAKMHDKQFKLNELMTLEKVTGVPIGQYEPDLYADRMNFSATEKQKLRNVFTQFKADQQAQAQAQMDLEQQKLNIEKTKALGQGLVDIHNAIKPEKEKVTTNGKAKSEK